MLAVALVTLSTFAGAPYPPSSVIAGIEWHWETYRSAATGSDLWPVTWAVDDNLYSAWGDGGGFGGTAQTGRVALGFARIEGPPQHFNGVNVNGGKDPENPATFPRFGKAGGLLACDGILYAWINRQDGRWPDVNQGLAWSTNKGRTWENSSWVFPKARDSFKPSTFLNCGREYADLPPQLEKFVYVYGIRQGDETNVYLCRVPTGRLRERAAFEFLAGLSGDQPRWSSKVENLKPIFTDSRGLGDLPTVIYNARLNRFVLTLFHKGPGQLGVFDAPAPWGPWTTIAYYEDWAGMGIEGHGLTCSFPAKWMSADGRECWCIFAAYGPGAKKGIQAHDRFNLVKAIFLLRSVNPGQKPPGGL